MLDFKLNDIRAEYPGFYNIYPIQHEVSVHSGNNDYLLNEKEEYYLDDNYGRIINSKIGSPYGDNKKLRYYFPHYSEKVIDSLRVPFRKIPIFSLDSIEQIKELIKKVEDENPTYTILLRGQTKLYTISRPPLETRFLYGDESVKEPSFHPSFLRTSFDETFIYSLWHSQTALLLNDVGVDLSKILSEKDFQEYQTDVGKIKGSPHFTPISLGYAQHYGLPSVGLDLTKDLKVALWFASHEMNINEERIATPSSIVDFSQSTLYIFRCPDDAVFSHKHIKPKHTTNTRPDRQDAWFSHVGWGFSKNQLASYLVCGIRLNHSILTLFENSYADHLFPSKETDLVLSFFLEMRKNKKNMGEVERALSKIYSLKETNS